MPQLVSIQQAARNALARWLTCELSSEDVRVEPRWVENDRPLAPRHITIIDAGPRRVEWLQPEAVSIVRDVADTSKVGVDWLLGFVEQPVQLDAWARTDVELDDIQARLDGSLNKGSRGLGIANTDPFEPGLRLPLADGWAPGIVDLLFDEPVILQSPSSVGEGEWRAMYRGRATAQLTQRSTHARIARALLKQRVYTRDVDLSAPPDTVIVQFDT